MAITTFANTTTQNLLTALDANFQTPVTIGTSPVSLGNTVSNIDGLTSLQLGTGTPITAYTTGTWTPTDQSGAGLVFTGVSAGYTIIGNMCFAYCQFKYPSTADGSGASTGGFPVTAANQDYAQTVSPVELSVTLAFPVIFQVVLNHSYGVFFNQLNNAQVTNAQLSGAVVNMCIIIPLS
jgi:hypothetical protein